MTTRRISVKEHTKRHGRIHVKGHKRSIYIPPGWKNVKFYRNKPYLATGIDKKGRTQYVYPETLSKKTAEQKFHRIKVLEEKLPKSLAKIEHDADAGQQDAQAVYTLYKTGFRPGSDKDTMADKEAFGAITLENKHVKVKPGNVVKFHFPAKKGTTVDKSVKDKRLASIMKERLNDEKIFDTTPAKVREYFQKVVGRKFKLKDLRTLRGIEVAKKAAKNATPKTVKKAVGEAVSQDLSNTEKVAIASYVAPEIIK